MFSMRVKCAPSNGALVSIWLRAVLLGQVGLTDAGSGVYLGYA
jgi:hypothetical protein